MTIQHEIPYTPPPTKRVICGAVKTRTFKGKIIERKCETVVTVVPGVDPAYRVGECSTCGIVKVIKNEEIV